MQQPQGMVSADIGEVRMERKSDFQTRAAESNRQFAQWDCVFEYGGLW
jgi:hypothetical protein